MTRSKNTFELEEFGLIWPRYAATKRFLRNLVRKANNSQRLAVHPHFYGRCNVRRAKFCGAHPNAEI